MEIKTPDFRSVWFPNYRFVIGSEREEFSFQEFTFPPPFTVKYTSSKIIGTTSYNLPKELEFSPSERKFKLKNSEERTSYTIRISGHLYDLHGNLIQTEDFDFKVTFVKPPPNEKCPSKIGYSKIDTDDIFRPEYKLDDMLDPSTGFPVKYDITIPKKLEGIMAGDAPFIKTMTTTLNSGRAPGFSNVVVRTTCNEKSLELRLPVLLRDSEALSTEVSCDIDFSWRKG